MTKWETLLLLSMVTPLPLSPFLVLILVSEAPEIRDYQIQAPQPNSDTNYFITVSKEASDPRLQFRMRFLTRALFMIPAPGDTIHVELRLQSVRSVNGLGYFRSVKVSAEPSDTIDVATLNANLAIAAANAIGGRTWDGSIGARLDKLDEPVRVGFEFEIPGDPGINGETLSLKVDGEIGYPVSTSTIGQPFAFSDSTRPVSMRIPVQVMPASYRDALDDAAASFAFWTQIQAWSYRVSKILAIGLGGLSALALLILVVRSPTTGQDPT